MFLGKLKKQRKTVWGWYENERNLEWPSQRTINALRWYVRHYPLSDYGYTGYWRSHMEYACDRMNGGRAKAILRLIKEQCITTAST